MLYGNSKVETLDNQCPLKAIWVGIGCKRGTPAVVIEQAIRSVLQAHDLAEDAIAGIATIDTKADEAGLVAFCRDRNLPLRFFAVDELRSVAIPNPSSATESSVGTPSVAEAAALLACSLQYFLTTPPTPHRSAERSRRSSRRSPTPYLCVPKQIIRNMGQAGLVTVAVARSRTI